MPVQFGHVEVKEQHVRAGGGHHPDRLPAVTRLAHNVHVGFLAEQVAQPAQDAPGGRRAIAPGWSRRGHPDGHRRPAQPGLLWMSTVRRHGRALLMCLSPEPAWAPDGSKPVPVSGLASSMFRWVVDEPHGPGHVVAGGQEGAAAD